MRLSDLRAYLSPHFGGAPVAIAASSCIHVLDKLQRTGTAVDLNQ